MIIYKQDLIANLSPTLIDPVMFIVAFGLGLGSYIENIGQLDYIHYVAPGLVVTTALFTAFFETSYGFFIRHRFENIYKAILTTPVGVDEIICGEFIWVGVKGAIMSSGVAVVLLGFGLIRSEFLALVPLLGFVVALACGSIGFIASSFVRNINQFQAVYALLISPMFFFSGVFYPSANLPDSVQIISSFSPLYHGVSLGKSWLSVGGDSDGNGLFHGFALIALTIVLIFVSARMIRKKLYQ